jgi:formylglycine-generating enzyme required for sulfatase activity
MRHLALLALSATLFAACAYGSGSSRDCPTCPEMVVVPAGSFAMGSPPDELNRGDDEGPVRIVTFDASFAIGRTEVTRGQFARFIDATDYQMNDSCLIWDGERLTDVAGKSWQDPGYPVTDRHPMVCVSWWDAANYARWLSSETGHSYRLPAEAEWEYASRGGSTGAYAFPGGEEAACTYGNVSDESARRDVPQWNAVACDDGVGLGTAPVASYQANGFGLYDTMGNVWEWVADCYREDFTGAPTDGSAWGDGGDCGTVLDRGGGFSNVFPGHLRAANRSKAPSPNIAVYSLGFRLARDLTPAEIVAQAEQRLRRSQREKIGDGPQ